jgi:hypothetical protein
MRFDKRIDRDEADTEVSDDSAQRFPEIAGLAVTILIDIEQPKIARRPVIEPAVEIALVELVMNGSRTNAAAELGLVVFEADQQTLVRLYMCLSTRAPRPSASAMSCNVRTAVFPAAPAPVSPERNPPQKFVPRSHRRGMIGP